MPVSTSRANGMAATRPQLPQPITEVPPSSVSGLWSILVYTCEHAQPRKFNLNERAILSTDARIVWEAANASGFTDVFDATGPQCQLLVHEADRVRIVSGTGTGLS
jgi:hypothetical protein